MNTCSTCSDADTCLTCNLIGHHREKINNVCECISGYYNIEGEFVCGQCNSRCKACDGGSASNCTECSADDNRELNSSHCDCISGYYENSSGVCASCNSKC